MPAAPSVVGKTGSQIAETYSVTMSSVNQIWSMIIVNSMTAVTCP